MDEFFEAMSQSSFGVAIRERAEAEGKIEGETATRRYLLARLWRTRFAQELDPPLLDRIAALPQEQYERIYDAVAAGVLSPVQVSLCLMRER